MQASILKQQIEGLPAPQFEQAWTCVEAIQAALLAAGPTAMLAMAFIRAQQEERLVSALMAQEHEITGLRNCCSAYNTENSKLVAANLKQARRLARLEKKLKA